MIGQDILVSAHILPYMAEDGTTYPEEKFVVHTWPGLLPGMNSGFNHHGLFFSIDHLYPKHVVQNKIGQFNIPQFFRVFSDIKYNKGPWNQELEFDYCWSYRAGDVEYTLSPLEGKG